LPSMIKATEQLEIQKMGSHFTKKEMTNFHSSFSFPASIILRIQIKAHKWERKENLLLLFLQRQVATIYRP
jgi:hypothetical protein